VVVAPSHCFRVLARLPPDCAPSLDLWPRQRCLPFLILLYRNWTPQHTRTSLVKVYAALSDAMITAAHAVAAFRAVIVWSTSKPSNFGCSR
jgi:hypothetical protein